MIEVICPMCKGIGVTCKVCNGRGIVHQRSKVEENKRRNEKSQKFAKRSREPYTKKELAIIMDCENYSIREAAKAVHRSIKAVETMRYRLRQKEASYGQK